MWGLKDWWAELFEMQADEKWPSIYSFFACFTGSVVIAVSHLFDMNVFIYSISTAQAEYLTCRTSYNNDQFLCLLSMCTISAGISRGSLNRAIRCDFPMPWNVGQLRRKCMLVSSCEPLINITEVCTQPSLEQELAWRLSSCSEKWQVWFVTLTH